MWITSSAITLSMLGINSTHISTLFNGGSTGQDLKSFRLIRPDASHVPDDSGKEMEEIRL